MSIIDRFDRARHHFYAVDRLRAMLVVVRAGSRAGLFTCAAARPRKRRPDKKHHIVNIVMNFVQKSAEV